MQASMREKLMCGKNPEKQETENEWLKVKTNTQSDLRMTQLTIVNMFITYLLQI